MCSPSRLIGRSKCAKRNFGSFAREGYNADYYGTAEYDDTYYDTAVYYRMDKIRESPVSLFVPNHQRLREVLS